MPSCGLAWISLMGWSTYLTRRTCRILFIVMVASYCFNQFVMQQQAPLTKVNEFIDVVISQEVTPKMGSFRGGCLFNGRGRDEGASTSAAEGPTPSAPTSSGLPDSRPSSPASGTSSVSTVLLGASRSDVEERPRSASAPPPGMRTSGASALETPPGSPDSAAASSISSAGSPFVPINPEPSKTYPRYHPTSMSPLQRRAKI